MSRIRLGLVTLVLLCACGGGDDGTVQDGSAEAGQDGTPNDTGVNDTGVNDTGVNDTGVNDTGVNDTGTSDGSSDGGIMDAPSDGPIIVDGGIVCDSVISPWHYVVDPVNGSDAVNSTGSGTSGNNKTAACAFKTITNAIVKILAANNPPNAGTQIIVFGPSTVSLAANGETFPINVPKNTLVTSSGGTVKVAVAAANVDMFKLAQTGSGLDSLTLDGTSNAAGHAVTAATGTDTTDKLTNLIVSSFGNDCVGLSGTGALTVGDNVKVSACGTNNARRSGFHATDGSYLAIKPPNTAVVIATNTLHGIQIQGTAHLDVTSTLGNSPPGTALVQVDANAASGVFIQQIPNPNNPPPLNTIDGAAIGGSTGIANSLGEGIAVFGGSQLKLRSSWVLKNLSNGVIVSTYPQVVNGASDTVGIDLGFSSNDWGKNRVQDQNSSNGAAGICLNLTVALNATLAARGNYFATNIDCTSMNTALSKGICASGAKQHVGISGSQMNSIVTFMCTN